MAVVLLLCGGSAQAHVVFAHGRSYGVMRPPGAAGKALSSLGDRVVPLTVGGPQSPLRYGGGSLMLSSKLYLIFWQAKAGEFESGYTEPIVHYAEDLHAESTHTTDEFSVADQYTDKAGKAITGKIDFGEAVTVTGYPPLEEAEGCTAANVPCVTDKQIREEVLAQIELHKAQNWPTDPANEPEAQYLLYTPKGVSVCELGEHGDECAPELFCAYHGEITKIGPQQKVAVYSALPYVPECDSGQAPVGVGGNKDADGTLDSEIHEIVESATDPDPPSGYTDSGGEEVADKCTGPIEPQEFPKIYGTPLGGSIADDTAFNQLIDGHSYYTQQIWSNAPTVTPTPVSPGEPAGCAARIGPSPSFTAPASGQTGQAIQFDGGGSYDIGGAISKYEWNFGDGSPPDTTSGAKPIHYFLKPDTYQVSLTVSDSGGTTDASTQTLPIAIEGDAVGAPSAAILAPAGGQIYAVGESVATSFTCADAAGAPGIASCTDSSNKASPASLDTATPGTHSYTVTALSLDGERGTTTIEYTVASPSAGPGGGSGGTSGSTSSSGTSSATSSTGGAGGPSSSTPGSSVTSSAGGAKPVATLTAARKLTLAIKACKKLKKNKRARCIAAAKRRYAPAKGKHQKPKLLVASPGPFDVSGVVASGLAR